MWKTESNLVRKLNNLNNLLQELSATELTYFNYGSYGYEINPRFEELKYEIYNLSHNINGYVQYFNKMNNTNYRLHVNYAEYIAEIL